MARRARSLSHRDGRVEFLAALQHTEATYQQLAHRGDDDLLSCEAPLGLEPADQSSERTTQWLVLPETWQHGRAPIMLAAAFSAVLVVLAVVDVGLPATQIGTAIHGWTLAWVNVTLASMGGFEAVRKGATIMRGETNPAGPDTHTTDGPLVAG